MPQILVVDDESSIRDVLRVVLADDGHDVRTAGDGREALARLDEGVPDLILLDLAMPGMDGWHFLEELHARGLRPSTRVLIMSGQFSGSEVIERTRGTARRFLAKPFDSSELRRIVSEMLAVEAHELFDATARDDTLARVVTKLDRVLD